MNILLHTINGNEIFINPNHIECFGVINTNSYKYVKDKFIGKTYVYTASMLNASNEPYIVNETPKEINDLILGCSKCVEYNSGDKVPNSLVQIEFVVPLFFKDKMTSEAHYIGVYSDGTYFPNEAEDGYTFEPADVSHWRYCTSANGVVVTS